MTIAFVSPILPLIALSIVTGVVLILLKRRVAGLVIFALAILFTIVIAVFCNVDRQYDEQMTYEVTDFGDTYPPSLSFTNSHGDSFSGGSAELAERLKRTRPPTVRVSMTATYDFGRFQSYHIFQIEGELQ